MNENQIYTNGTDVGVYANNCAVGCTAGCGLLLLGGSYVLRQAEQQLQLDQH